MTINEQKALLRSRMDALQLTYTQDMVEQLIAYQALLAQWNTRMNLTGDASFEALLDRHLMDSLTPLTVDGLLKENAEVIDVGSGAGFPGIPLAIVRPDLKITLLDSLKKRVGFLDAAADALELANMRTVHARAEDAAQDARYRERFDAALARAVAALPVLLELLLPFVKIGGRSICYKGPSVEEELGAGRTAAGLLGATPPHIIPLAVPYLPEHRHCLVVDEKRRHTKPYYPRKAGTPSKIPLGI